MLMAQGRTGQPREDQPSRSALHILEDRCIPGGPRVQQGHPTFTCISMKIVDPTCCAGTFAQASLAKVAVRPGQDHT